jgi:acetolactate synthase-1/2/3 large subunit
MIRSVTKHAARATAPAEIPGVVREAFAQLRTGRTRPVEIEIPPDTLFATADVRLLPPAPPRRRAAGDPDKLDAAARLLGAAERPLIWAGGGVQGADAGDELLALAELLQAPVVATWNGRGALSDRHDLAQNPIAGRSCCPRPTSSSPSAPASSTPPPPPGGWSPAAASSSSTSTRPRSAATTRRPIGLEADAKAGLAALVERVARHNRRRPSREAELASSSAASPSAPAPSAPRPSTPSPSAASCRTTASSSPR